MADSKPSFPTCVRFCAVNFSPIRPLQTKTARLARDQVLALKWPVPLVHVLIVNSPDRPPPPPSSGPRADLAQNPSSAPPLSCPTPPRQTRDLDHVPCPSHSRKMRPQGAPTLPPGHRHPSNGLSVAKSACRAGSNLAHSNHRRVNPTIQVRKCRQSRRRKQRRMTRAPKG